MKTRLLLSAVIVLWSMGLLAQTTRTTFTQDIPASALGGSFNGCNGDMITLGGDVVLTTTIWVDGAGDTHTRSQVVTNNLTANSSANVPYTVIFSQKMVEVVSEGITTEQTMTSNLRLLGAGALNNQIVFMEVHFTNPEGVATGPNVNHVWSKCTG
ncbi:MAG: hypothetical protein ACXVZQ_01885 [Terriglobales bacterium]